MGEGSRESLGRPDRVRFAYLGSGSRGNAAVIEAGGTRVLLDCGFSVNETIRRLARLGLEPEDIDAVLVTHEHADHIGGVARFVRRFRTPAWMTPGTFAAAPDRNLPTARHLNCHEPLGIGDLEITPMPVPHDAREPCQFAFSDGDRRLGILTDVGHVTRHIVDCLTGCHALVVECNHDPDMLASGPYPPALRARVGGQWGHLSNGQASDLVGRLGGGGWTHLVAVHISHKNNTAALAREALAYAAGCQTGDIQAAAQDEGLDWREV